nr:F390 synthetase-related protein [Cupriavidus sp. BIS7]
MHPNALSTVAYFAQSRWRLAFRDRAKLEAWQQARLARFLRDVLPRAPYYRDFRNVAITDLPIMDKSSMMADFDARNTRGICLGDAFEIALRGETTRDFAPTLGGGADALTVGLSSGTSGNRGVFLVSKAERLRWAGILLGRVLPAHLLKRLLLPWTPSVRVAFFLRANSNLYTTLSSRRIDFGFFDVLSGVEPALPRLNASQPDVLVAPPSLLRTLAGEAAAGRLDIRPSHVISVAEVLEDGDRAAVRHAFGVEPHQIYQATEGFLGYTCERGTLHLNESYVHIEPDWIDEARTRFQPIVTDFTRDTQLIVRYRLNDVLRVSDEPCRCGRVERAIAAIEGRADEVLWLPSRIDGRGVALYPDLIRRAMLFAGPSVREFEVVQSGMQWGVGLLADGDRQVAVERVRAEFEQLWRRLGLESPALDFSDWRPPARGVKRRRVRLVAVPEGLACTF